MSYSWVQPCCQDCYAEHWGHNEPSVLRSEYRDVETCVYCERSTQDGIYVRIDPRTAAHPTRKNE